jgi:integrase
VLYIPSQEGLADANETKVIWGHNGGTNNGRLVVDMLTELEVRRAKPRDKDYKLADANALYAYIATSGRKTWRWKYRFAGKERRLVFGAWPEISLKRARELRDDARQILRSNRDPGQEIREERAAPVEAGPTNHAFEIYARAWHAKERPRWKAVHAKDVITSLERDLFPALGKVDIRNIQQPQLLNVLAAVEKRGAIETAHRLRQRAERIFDYADAKGCENNNPARRVKAALALVPRSVLRPALTDIVAIRTFMGDVDVASASPVTRLGSRFMAVTAQRPGMINALPWGEIEGVDWTDVHAQSPDALWRIPAERMKIEIDSPDHQALEHIVPLAPAAVDILRAIRPLTGRASYVFPSSWDPAKPMSENTVNALYRRLGYVGRHVPHGWRSSFSTVMNGLMDTPDLGDTRLMLNRLVVDLMLAHIPPGMSASELVYNRNRYLKRMRAIAIEWSDLILADAPSAFDLLDVRRG